ncbi:hypothetical protein MY11210_002474 [Beauveria gryllotalpidicola]
MRPFFTLSTLAAAAAILVPGPSGPYAVAYRTLILTDHARQDPYASTPQSRRVPVSAYLPVSAPCPNKQTLPYMTPAVAAHYGQTAVEIGLANDSFARLAMEYCSLDKPCGDGKKRTTTTRKSFFPLVLYDTGFGLARSLYGAKARDLASQGYVVVTVDHPYDADIIEFPDGSVVKSGKLNVTEPEIVKFLEVRAQDLSFVLSQLHSNHTARRHLLAQYPSTIDFSRTAAVGHSLGGVASILLADRSSSSSSSSSGRPAVRGAVNMDGGVRGTLLTAGTSAPTMQFGTAGHARTDPSWDVFWPRLRGPAAELALANSTHGTFSDGPTLGALFVDGQPEEVREKLREAFGAIDPREAERAITGALVAGFEFAFEGRTEGVDKIHERYSSLQLTRSHL